MSATFNHRLPVQIRFNDLDSYRHVNNNAYFSYYDLGKEGYFREVFDCDFRLQPVVPVIASIKADFFVPIVYGDEVEVETRVTHLGNKSFTLLQRAVRVGTEQVLCQCETVMVCYNVEEKCSAVIPPAYRAAIKRFEGLED